MAPLRQSGVRSAARAGVGDFEAEMIARGRRRVAIAVGVVAVALLTVAGVVVGPELLERRHDPAAVAKVLAALDVIKRGDSASASEAAKLADEALAIDPGYRGANATRGMALLLQAADLRDRIDRLERQRPGLDRGFKKAEEAGDKAAQDLVRDQMGQLATQHAALVNEITRVKGEAEPLINDAYKGAENDVDVIRAMGLMRALEADETNVAKLVKAYRHEVEVADGWADLIAGLAGAAGKGSPEKRNAAIAALEQALAQDPAMTIAHVGIGRSRLDLGDHAGARAALEKALAATPENALVKRLLADVQMSGTEAAERTRKKAEAQAPPPAQPPVSDANPANSEPDSLGTGNPPATRK